MPKKYLFSVEKTADGYLFEDDFDRADGDLGNEWFGFGIGTFTVTSSALSINTTDFSALQNRDVFDNPTYDWISEVSVNGTNGPEPEISFAILEAGNGFRGKINNSDEYFMSVQFQTEAGITETVFASGSTSNPVASGLRVRWILTDTSFMLLTANPSDNLWTLEETATHAVTSLDGLKTVEIAAKDYDIDVLFTSVRAHENIHASGMIAGFRTGILDDTVDCRPKGSYTVDTTSLVVSGFPPDYTARTISPSGDVVDLDVRTGDAYAMFPKNSYGTPIGLACVGSSPVGGSGALPVVLIDPLPLKNRGGQYAPDDVFEFGFRATANGTYSIFLEDTTLLASGSYTVGDNPQFEFLVKLLPANQPAVIHIEFTETKYNRTVFKKLVSDLTRAEELEPVLNPSLALLAPNGTELWNDGEVHQILWESTDLNTTIDIDVSTDSGSTYTPVATGLPDTGSYDWTIPFGISGTSSRIKLTYAPDPRIRVISANDFTIIDSTLVDFLVLVNSGRVIYWYDPSDSSNRSVSGGLVDQLVNKGLSGPDLFGFDSGGGASDAKKPDLLTASKNGLDTVGFLGDDRKWLVSSSRPSPTSVSTPATELDNQGYGLFVVAKHAAGSAFPSDTMFSASPESVNQVTTYHGARLATNAATGEGFVRTENSVGNGVVTIPFTGTTTGNWYIYGALSEQGPANTVSAYLNGSFVSSSVTAYNYGAGGRVTMGCPDIGNIGVFPVTNEHFFGEAGDAIITQPDLSTAEVATIFAYLNAKWDVY